MRLLRHLGLGLGISALAVALGLGALYAWMRQSLPQTSGELSAKALGAALEIVRDAEGIPHLYAANERDGWFGMGYVHAQDRLWQMDFQRRVALGRLSEVLGERAFDNDRLLRTLGFAGLSEQIVARLDPQTRDLLEAYSAGVNAYLATNPVLPPEFHVFQANVELWKPSHTVAWLLVMAWDLSGNWRSELARLRLSGKIGAERTNEIIPAYPGERAAPLPDFRALYAQAEPVAKSLLALSPGSEEGAGSNSWVLAGTRTTTGKPLLANDPHLGLQAPALWYFAHVATPGGNVLGGTLPGVPFVVLGRNDRVAWTMTTTTGDTQDLYIERVAPGDPESYLTPEGTAKFAVREEVIRVGTEERRIRVRSTRHGPVLSDVVRQAGAAAPKGHVMALAWTALTPDNAGARAGFAMNRARDAQALVAAARDFHAPQQNVVYADLEGRIGMIAPGLVPLRRADNPAQGRVPVPGWDARYDWTGLMAFEDLPAVADPAAGSIVTANHRITPPGYTGFISVDWAPPYRADRIEALLAAAPIHSLESMRTLQADTVSRLARELLPAARRAQPATDAGRQARDLLLGWEGDMVAESGAPLAFMAWYREVSRLVYADELGELFPDFWEMRGTFMIRVLRDEDGAGRWCDDVATPAVETCPQLADRAFDLAAKDLGRRYGEPGAWRWGEAHRAAGQHRPMGFFPLVGRLFNVMPRTPGDTYSVNVGHMTVRDGENPFANRHAASLRAIYDLADPERSLFMHSTGQSGNVLSPWYANLAERWSRVEYVPIATRREALPGNHVLRLVPAK